MEWAGTEGGVAAEDWGPGLRCKPRHWAGGTAGAVLVAGTRRLGWEGQGP